MSLEIAPQEQQPSLPHTHRSLTRHWPALFALLGIGLIYAVVSEQLTLGPRWLLLVVFVVLVIPLGFSIRHGLFGMARTTALDLLRDAALIWIVNILTFSTPPVLPPVYYYHQCQAKSSPVALHTILSQRKGDRP